MSAEKRARELLAAEYRKVGMDMFADLMDKAEPMALRADEAALSAITAALTPQWQDISTAPRDGTPILLYSPRWQARVLLGYWDYYVEAWHLLERGHPYTQPTHWLPLPAPPEGEV